METAWRFATAEREAGSTSVMALNRGAEAHVCNVWAVGGNVTQIYNGSAWTTVSSPAAGTVSQLSSASAVPGGTIVWAAGSSGSGTATNRSFSRTTSQQACEPLADTPACS